MKKIKKMITGLCACTMLTVAAAGCSGPGENKETTQATTTMAGDADPALKNKMTDTISVFGVQLFKNALNLEEDDGKNVLISPYSVYMALGMTANGASGESHSQMEEVLGMKIDDINKVLSQNPGSISGSGNALKSANSIWINKRDGFTVKNEFKELTETVYGAAAEELPFNDAAKEKINSWVRKNTDNMIDSVINRINSDAMMYLINALAFDAKWEEPYKKEDLAETEFTGEDGIKEAVSLMHSREGIYFKDDKAEGFKKYYENGDYSFLAIKPLEGVNVKDYVNDLSAEYIKKLMGEDEGLIEARIVYAAIPKFMSDYETELSGSLYQMGMSAPFAGGFDGISEDKDLRINEVIHKTHIDVFEEGTKAGAVTSVGLQVTGVYEENRVEVYLDRPFIYMIIDENEHIPIFTGCVMHIGQ